MCPIFQSNPIAPIRPGNEAWSPEHPGTPSSQAAQALVHAMNWNKCSPWAQERRSLFTESWSSFKILSWGLLCNGKSLIYRWFAGSKPPFGGGFSSHDYRRVSTSHITKWDCWRVTYDEPKWKSECASEAGWFPHRSGWPQSLLVQYPVPSSAWKPWHHKFRADIFGVGS